MAETEQDRLQRLYSEMSDEHLLELAEAPDELTDGARVAISSELGRRGLRAEVASPEPVPFGFEPEREQGFGAGIPGLFPGGAAEMEQALDSPQVRNGLQSLIHFYDGMQLAQACEILEADGIEPVIEPIAGDAQSGVPPRFEIWLEPAEIERAQALLRARMGLFPLPDVDGAEEFFDEENDGVVGSFTTAADAEEARAVLADRGIEATVRRITGEEDDAPAWEVSVAPAEQEQALEIVAARLGVQ